MVYIMLSYNHFQHQVIYPCQLCDSTTEIRPRLINKSLYAAQFTKSRTWRVEFSAARVQAGDTYPAFWLTYHMRRCLTSWKQLRLELLVIHLSSPCKCVSYVGFCTRVCQSGCQEDEIPAIVPFRWALWELKQGLVILGGKPHRTWQSLVNDSTTIRGPNNAQLGGQSFSYAPFWERFGVHVVGKGLLSTMY